MPAEEDGFVVYVPALRGCVSEGESEEEALENIKDAIGTWLDSWDDVKKQSGTLVRRVAISR